MKTKFYFLLGFLFISIGIAKSQSIKEYFIPSGGKNLSNYTWTKSNSTTVKIWYVRVSDTAYRIDQVIFIHGKASVGESRTVSISKSEVRVSKVVYFNYTIADEGTIRHEVPTVWIKMPNSGQNVSWSFSPMYSTSKCTAEFTSVTINGQNKKAIKVTNTPFEDNKLLTKGITYDYYVEGIGFWKRKLQDGTDFQILDNQEYDPEYY